MCYAPERECECIAFLATVSLPIWKVIVIAIGASRIYRSLAEYHRKMLLARQIAMYLILP